MDIAHLTELLERVRAGDIEIEDALGALRHLPYEDLGFARLDHHRALRTGFPEIVFGESKTPAQAALIMERLATRNRTVLCTRSSPETFAAIQQRLPHATYHDVARLVVFQSLPQSDELRTSGIVVVTAGTGDLPVAEEAAIIAEAMGNDVQRISDVGVAGVHRVLSCMETLQQARVVIVVAGMEGTLPGLVAGLVGVPVIGVPTSVGYGASFGGVSPLLTMLNSCALGLAVVNIDNGVGAGMMAAMINRQFQEDGSHNLNSPSG